MFKGQSIQSTFVKFKSCFSLRYFVHPTNTTVHVTFVVIYLPPSVKSHFKKMALLQLHFEHVE